VGSKKGNRDIFYDLEETGILQREKDETTIKRGQFWRIFYWKLNKWKIIKLAYGAKETPAEDGEADTSYADIEEDIDAAWAYRTRP
tara:strand:- start:408 stop:665 length:258 start_codon:yes stop_codon:yes gene_type:complete